MQIHPSYHLAGVYPLPLGVGYLMTTPVQLLTLDMGYLLMATPKECSNYHTIALFSHASKVMIKILQARLQQYVNHELPDVQAGLRKDRGTRGQIYWIIEKAREFQKNIYFCFIDYAKAFDLCGSQQTVENS